MLSMSVLLPLGGGRSRLARWRDRRRRLGLEAASAEGRSLGGEGGSFGDFGPVRCGRGLLFLTDSGLGPLGSGGLHPPYGTLISERGLFGGGILCDLVSLC